MAGKYKWRATQNALKTPTEAALTCASIRIVVALRTLPKQAPPALRDPQPLVALQLGYRGTRLLLCLCCLPPILVVAVHYEPSESRGFVPAQMYKSELKDKSRRRRRPYFFKGLGRTAASGTVSSSRPASSVITKAFVPTPEVKTSYIRECRV